MTQELAEKLEEYTVNQVTGNVLVPRRLVNDAAQALRSHAAQSAPTDQWTQKVDEAIALLKAAGLPAPVPAGKRYVLIGADEVVVPKDPTSEMIAAGIRGRDDACDAAPNGRTSAMISEYTWRYMRAASPRATGETGNG